MAPTLTESARRLRAARRHMDNAMESCRLSALAALETGATEVDVAAVLGVNRTTVRRWQGK
jgi:Homeodomain-like domain